MMRKRKGILLDDVRIWNEKNAFFYMENSTGEQYQISRKLYYQLIYLDQTNYIPSDDEDFPSEFLQKKGFISTSRLIKQSMFVRRWIVAYIGERGRSLFPPICHVINKRLPFLALVLLVLGIVANAIRRTPFIWYDAIWIHIIGIIITVIVHELGHLVTYVDYREKEKIVIRDVGITFLLYFPIAGYICVKYTDLLEKKDQIQGLAAGLEMNIATIGLILILRNLNPYCDMLSPVILYSVPAIIFNSMPINGTDGCQMLSVLLGVNIGALAKKTLSDKRRMKKMVREGPVGWLCLLLFSFQYLLKIIVVLLEAGSVIFLMILGYYYFFSH